MISVDGVSPVTEEVVVAEPKIQVTFLESMDISQQELQVRCTSDHNRQPNKRSKDSNCYSRWR